MRLTRSRHGHHHDPAYGITTADSSHLDDVAKRQKQYAATMGFRVVAIIVVVFVPGLSVLERVIIGLVATIIPYVAVIRANGGDDRAEDPTNLMIGPPRQSQLPGAERTLPGAGGEGEDRPTAHWVVDEEGHVEEAEDYQESEADPDGDQSAAAASGNEEAPAAEFTRGAKENGADPMAGAGDPADFGSGAESS